jgi:hypothetical protein
VRAAACPSSVYRLSRTTAVTRLARTCASTPASAM